MKNNSLSTKGLSLSINQKVKELKDLIASELAQTITSVSIFINCEGVEFTIKERSAESLKKSGISMRNIKGDFIR